MRKFVSVFIVCLITLYAFVSYSSNLIEGKLKNGLAYRIYLKSDLPVVAVNLKIKAGSVFDPEGRFGLAYVVAHSLENCNTPMLTAEKLRIAFDKYGIKGSVGVSKGFIDINFVGLSENIDRIFCIINEFLHSKFDKAGIDFVKREAVNSLLSLKNDKDYLAIHSAFVGLIEQPSINHTSIGEIEDVKRIERRDVLRFFNTYFKPNNMVISVSGGGFDPQIVIDEMKFYFENRKGLRKPVFENPRFLKGLHVRNIVKPNTKQSYIYFAFPSFGCCSKEYYATIILAHILGGGLDSVLMKDIRTKHGYAYSAFAFNYELPKKGVFVVGLQTENRFTLSAIDRVFADIKDIDKFITAKRVKLAKDYFSGSIPVSLQNNQSIAVSLSNAYFNGIDELPWIHFEKSIDNITVEDVKKVASKIFNSGSLSIGVVSYKDLTTKIKSIAKKYGYR